MISRRSFLAASAALPFIARGADKPALHVGLVADPQYADVPPIATRFYRESVGKLGAAIDHLNGQELDFCVNVGDTIDQQWKSFDEMLKLFGKSKHKFYHLLGNHDFEVEQELKLKAPARLGLERRYYSVTQNGFCFVMLDTNDVSVYAYPINSKEFFAAFESLKQYAATGALHAQPWNGAVGAAHMKWLDETCKKAAEDNQKVIIFAHHPIFPFPHNHNAWNSEALLRFIDGARNVVAWINGHNHAGNFAVRGGVPFITLKGMVETQNTNAFATAQIYSDRMVIAGSGREPSREVKFRTA
jgi:manganese-dependent ADP-ribose/CDP-alcohol diphosphatase